MFTFAIVFLTDLRDFDNNLIFRMMYMNRLVRRDNISEFSDILDKNISVFSDILGENILVKR